MKAFNAYYEAQPAEVQAHFGGPSSIKNYEYCGLCHAHYTTFRESLPGDCPDGCTLSPIIRE